jgi:DNA-binding response OmpR family regulator
LDEKILIVEDDTAINRLISDALTGAGYCPQSAFSGSEAMLVLPKGGAYVGDDKTVNVHISNLRAKLTGHSPHNHIKTVWGVGFRLAE